MTKGHKSDYGNYILNNKENLLKKKRKIIMMKRTMVIFIVLCSILLTLGFTLPVFNLTEVKISGNNLIGQETILTSAAIEPEINIFKINTSKVKEILMENAYIKDVKVKRVLPSKLSINVEERKIAFSAQGADGIYTIDENGRVLGVKETIETMEVLTIEGIPAENLVVGQVIQGQEGNIEGANIIHKFLSEKGYFEQYPQMKLEINNYIDYKLYVDGACIKLGTSEDMNEKLAKAFSVLATPQYMGMKGYIDVSFKGNPVVYKEN